MSFDISDAEQYFALTKRTLGNVPDFHNMKILGILNSRNTFELIELLWRHFAYISHNNNNY